MVLPVFVPVIWRSGRIRSARSVSVRNFYSETPHQRLRQTMTVIPPGTVENAAAVTDTINNLSVNIRSNFGNALGLSTLAGLSTGIGALVVVIWPDINQRRLGMWEAAAAGFMISVSLVDLIPTALEDISILQSAFSSLVGAGLLLALQSLLPEPDLSNTSFLPSKAGADERAVLWSGILTALTIFLHNGTLSQVIPRFSHHLTLYDVY